VGGFLAQLYPTMSLYVSHEKVNVLQIYAVGRRPQKLSGTYILCVNATAPYFSIQ